MMAIGSMSARQREIRILLPGDPVGKRRHRAGRNKKTGAPVQFKDDAAVRQERDTCYHLNRAMADYPCFTFPIPKDTPIQVDIDCRFAIPESWSGKKKALAAQGLILPTGKPDLDNIEKHILDCCNVKMSGVWHDDAAVVRVTKQKRYGSHALTYLTIRWVELSE